MSQSQISIVHADHTYQFLESRKTNALLLPSLHRIIEQYTGVEDVQLSLVEDSHSRQKGAPWALKGIREEAAENYATEASESAHENE